MTTPRDPDRLIRAILAEGPTELADRSYDAVRSDIERTRQRVVIGPWRESDMSNITRIAIAIAAVVVVAVIAYNLLPGTSGVGGSPSPSPTVAPTPAPTPIPSPTEAAFPPAGPLAAGTHTAILEGIRVSFSVPGPGWEASPDGGFILKGDGEQPGSLAIAMWESAPENVYSDPCAHTRLNPPPSHTAVELAAAAAAIPGTDLVSGPVSVEVGGFPAQHVVFTIRDDLGCDPKDAYLWVDDGSGAANNWHWASALGSTHQVWITEVDGKIIWIDSETFEGGGTGPDLEVQQVIDSIQFE